MHLSSGSIGGSRASQNFCTGIFYALLPCDLFLGIGRGIVNPVPVDVAKAMEADLIIAVNLKLPLTAPKIGAEATPKSRSLALQSNRNKSTREGSQGESVPTGKQLRPSKTCAKQSFLEESQ